MANSSMFLSKGKSNEIVQQIKRDIQQILGYFQHFLINMDKKRSPPPTMW